MRRISRALMAAAALLLLLSLAAAYMSIISYRERVEEEEARRMFVEWKAKYRKTYNDTGEEERRYAVFKDNRRQRPLGLNVFGDLTVEEINTKLPGLEPCWFPEIPGGLKSGRFPEVPCRNFVDGRRKKGAVAEPG